MMKVVLNVLTLLVALLTRVSATEEPLDVVKPVENRSVATQEVALDMAKEPSYDIFSVDVVSFDKIAVLSVAPKKGHKLTSVVNGEQTLFKCREDDEKDKIDEVLIRLKSDSDFILISSTYGITYFEITDGNYKEITNVEDLPSYIKDILPLDLSSEIILPICGSRRLTPSDDGYSFECVDEEDDEEDSDSDDSDGEGAVFDFDSNRVYAFTEADYDEMVKQAMNHE
uniref:Membrane protein, putative n=1 Tax=Babesia bovis TaxID=5865 RepID=S6BEA0_BABBO|nr:membrane protein, putative [Babesia bovis]